MNSSARLQTQYFAAGVTMRPQRCVDLVKHYARIEFDGVTVDESAQVGSLADFAHESFAPGRVHAAVLR